MSKIITGSKVAYSVQWLRSIGEGPTSELAHARGTVTRLIPLGRKQLAEINWGDENIPKKVLTDNLAIVGPNRKFANVD